MAPRTYAMIGVASVVSAVAGAAAGFFVAKKKLETKYAELATQEIAEAKELYKRLYKKDEFSTPQSANETLKASVEEAVDALRSYQGQSEDKVTAISLADDAEVVVKNVFTSGLPTANEMGEQDETVPHIITEEQFLENGTEWDQASLTWFAGDGVLTDERDEPIAAEAEESTVGDCLKHFANMPEDAHIIYVRNPRMKMEFEIARSMGKYAEEILGFGQR